MYGGSGVSPAAAMTASGSRWKLTTRVPSSGAPHLTAITAADLDDGADRQPARWPNERQPGQRIIVGRAQRRTSAAPPPARVPGGGPG